MRHRAAELQLLPASATHHRPSIPTLTTHGHLSVRGYDDDEEDDDEDQDQDDDDDDEIYRMKLTRIEPLSQKQTTKVYSSDKM